MCRGEGAQLPPGETQALPSALGFRAQKPCCRGATTAPCGQLSPPSTGRCWRAPGLFLVPHMVPSWGAELGHGLWASRLSLGLYASDDLFILDPPARPIGAVMASCGPRSRESAIRVTPVASPIQHHHLFCALLPALRPAPCPSLTSGPKRWLAAQTLVSPDSGRVGWACQGQCLLFTVCHPIKLCEKQPPECLACT